MITIADYIYQLKEVQSTLEIIRGDLDRAIDKMENGDETGSRLEALSSQEMLKLAQTEIYKATTTKIF